MPTVHPKACSYSRLDYQNDMITVGHTQQLTHLRTGPRAVPDLLSTGSPGRVQIHIHREFKKKKIFFFPSDILRAKNEDSLS